MALSEEPPLEIEVTREQREREREGRRRERGREGRRRKFFSLFEIEIYRIYSLSSPRNFFTPFSFLSRLEPHGRQMMRVPRGDVVTSLDVLPPFILHPANDTFSTQLSLASVISYSYGPPIRIGRSIFEVESKIMKNSFSFLNSRWKKDCAKIVFDSSRVEEKCWHGNRNRSG